MPEGGARFDSSTYERAKEKIEKIDSSNKTQNFEAINQQIKVAAIREGKEVTIDREQALISLKKSMEGGGGAAMLPKIAINSPGNVKPSVNEGTSIILESPEDQKKREKGKIMERLGKMNIDFNGKPMKIDLSKITLSKNLDGTYGVTSTQSGFAFIKTSLVVNKDGKILTKEIVAGAWGMNSKYSLTEKADLLEIKKIV